MVLDDFISLEFFADLLAYVCEKFTEFWNFLNQNLFDFLEDLLDGDGDGIISEFIKIPFEFFDAIGATGITVLEFLVGGGLAVFVIFAIIKFYLPILD